MNALGRHLLIELHGCEPSILDDIDVITDLLVRAANMMCVTILNVMAHKFQPQGVTAIVMIAESHLSIHTWPEHQYAAVDVFTCNGAIPDEVQSCIAETLKASQVTAVEIRRGVLSPERQHVLSCAKSAG